MNFVRRFEKPADLAEPVCVDSPEITQLPYNLKNLVNKQAEMRRWF
jgi:hypothetical protein